MLFWGFFKGIHAFTGFSPSFHIVLLDLIGSRVFLIDFLLFRKLFTCFHFQKFCMMESVMTNHINKSHQQIGKQNNKKRFKKPRRLTLLYPTNFNFY